MSCGQSRVGGCITWIKTDGTLEIADRFVQRFDVVKVSQVLLPALQISIVSVEVNSLMAGAALLWCRQRDMDLTGNRLGNLLLQSQNVLELSFIAAAPHRTILRRVDQTDRDADTIPGAKHRTLRDGLHSEPIGDLRQRPARSFITHDGGYRNHAQRPDPCQVADERVGDSIREVLLAGVPGEVFER